MEYYALLEGFTMIHPSTEACGYLQNNIKNYTSRNKTQTIPE
jgi:hypothetical protein